MLRKIDCVMVRVEDLEGASAYYSRVFGLKRLWRDASSIGMGFPESDAELVLHERTDIPARVDVNYLVDSVEEASATYVQEGCKLLVAPFEIAVGKCAVVEDPFGVVLSILDLSKGTRAPG